MPVKNWTGQAVNMKHLIGIKGGIIILTILLSGLMINSIIGSVKSSRWSIIIIYAIPVILFFGSFIALIKLKKNGGDLFKLEYPNTVLMAGFTIFSIVLHSRLFATGYGNNIADLDFGKKITAGNYTGDNIAFTSDPESVGHFLQGILLASVFPVWYAIYPKPITSIITGCASSAAVIYPVYNTIKRMDNTLIHLDHIE